MECPSSSSSSSLSKRAKGPGNISHCLVDGCNADLNLCRDYHRRHKVCEVHSKTAKVTIGGREQRFCQQCSRFHSLVEFDEGKRSCRKRLDGHNRRRRKPQPDSNNTNRRLLSFNNSPPSSSSTIIKPEKIYSQHNHMYFNERPFLNNNHHQIHFLQGDNNLDPANDHALSLLSSTRPEVNGLRHYGSGYSFGPETAAESSSTTPSFGSSSSNVWPTLSFPTVFGGEGSSASGPHQTLTFMYGSD